MTCVKNLPRMAEAAAAAAAAPRPGPPASSWPLAALASQGKLRFSLSCKTAIEGFRDLYCKACLSGQACTERMDIDAWALRWKELVEAKGAIPDPTSSDRHLQQALFPKVLEMLRFFADPKAKPAPRLALPHRATQEYWCAWARSRLAEDEGGWIVQAAKSGVQADELAALIAAGKGGVKAKRSADGGEAAGESESEASDKQARTSGSNAPHAPDAAAVGDAATGGGEPVFREAPAPAPNGTGGRGPRPRWPEDGVPVVLEERRAKKKAAAAKERRTEASPDRDGSSASEASEDDDEEDGDAEEEVVVRKGVRRKTQEAKGKKAAKRKPGRPAKPSSKKRATAEVVATNQDEEGRARMPAAAAKDVTPPLVSSAPVKPVAAELPSPSKDSTATPMSKPAADAYATH